MKITMYKYTVFSRINNHQSERKRQIMFEEYYATLAMLSSLVFLFIVCAFDEKGRK